MRDRAHDGGLRPKFSIVIPARDEAKSLAATLDAVARQTYADFETIVVANGCIDETAAIAERYARVIRLAEPGLARARNVGARAARGEILLHLDADVVLSPRALQLAADRFGAAHAVGTFAGRPSLDRLWYRGLLALRGFAFRAGLYRGTLGTIVCRRDHFLSVGGFDPGRMPRANRDLVRRLLQLGRPCYLAAPATVSVRRWARWGPWRLIRFWFVVYLRSLAGRTDGIDYEPVR